MASFFNTLFTLLNLQILFCPNLLLCFAQRFVPVEKFVTERARIGHVGKERTEGALIGINAINGIILVSKTDVTTDQPPSQAKTDAAPKKKGTRTGIKNDTDPIDEEKRMIMGSGKKGKVDRGNQKMSLPVFLVSTVITFLNCGLAPVFILLNVGTLKSLIVISRDKQPLFLLFAAVHLICLIDLVIAMIEGVVIWTDISRKGCEMLGLSQITIFLSLSLILSTICLYRITAVLRPRWYKIIARRKVVQKIIAVIITSSILLSILLIATKTTRFRYLGRPHSIGCSLFVLKKMLHIFTSLLIIITLLVNLILASTHCVLYRYFGKPTSTTKEITAMKKGALFVTSLTTFSYFICYFPAVIVNFILNIDHVLILEIGAPYRLILDFTLTLLPHLYSCILPLCLVTGKTLKKVTAAVKVTKQSDETF